jgi:hypothetical protein
MEYLHQEFNLRPGDMVEVSLTGNAANVLLLDTANFESYKAGRQYTYYGGYARTSPFRLAPPHPGRWHLVIDLGGASGNVRASGSIISRQLSS